MDLLQTAVINDGAGGGAFHQLGAAEQNGIGCCTAFADMLQTTGVHHAARRQPAAINLLRTTSIDDRRDGLAVYGLRAAIVDDGSGGFAGFLHQLRTAIVDAGAGCGSRQYLSTAAKHHAVRGCPALINMLNPAAVHDGARRQRAAMHQLGTATVDHCGDSSAVYGLRTAIVNDGAGGFTGLLNQLRTTVVEVRTGYRAGHDLIAAAKDGGVGCGTADVNVLDTPAVYRRVLRETTAIDELDAAGVNDALNGAAVNSLHATSVNNRLACHPAFLHSLHTTSADNGAISPAGDRLRTAAVKLRARCRPVHFNNLCPISDNGTGRLAVLPHNLRTAILNTRIHGLPARHYLRTTGTDGMVGG